jgi:VWFA-related protein
MQRGVLGLCALLAAGLATPQQQSVFRGGVNLVLVDAYPRGKDGRLVEGLSPNDFEVTEDGAPQKVDQFEFVRVEPAATSEIRDPNNTREMLQLAADPHNGVLVVFLDLYHVTLSGSQYMRAPLTKLLDRVVARNTLFGVMTPKLPVTALVLARKTDSIEAQLQRYWNWGLQEQVGNDPGNASEDEIDACFPPPPATIYGDSPLARELKDRSREERTLQHLEDLIEYLGTLREARSSIALVTRGWKLFEPADPARLPKVPPPSITTTNGRLGIGDRSNGQLDEHTCQALALRWLTIDDRRRFDNLVRTANRSNIVFYPINPDGLEIEATKGTEELRVLAVNTDGFAVVDTNDLTGGAVRIAEDLSAYYLLGYYSTNTKTDGKLREIKVRVRERPDVKVVARRWYTATSAKDVAALAAASAKSSASALPSGFTEAFASLGRSDGSRGLAARAVADDGEVAVVAELSDSELAKWAKGADVSVSVAEEGGTPATATGHIEAGTKSVLVRVPVAAGAHTWQVTAQIPGNVDLIERMSVRTADAGVVGPTLVFRGTPAASSPLKPVADQLFHRNERAHLEWAIKKPLENRAVRLLDQRGQPMAVNVTATERDVAGKPILAADLSLAPLSPADYVLELTATAGGATDTRYIAIRVIR